MDWSHLPDGRYELKNLIPVSVGREVCRGILYDRRVQAACKGYGINQRPAVDTKIGPGSDRLVPVVDVVILVSGLVSIWCPKRAETEGHDSEMVE